MRYWVARARSEAPTTVTFCASACGEPVALGPEWTEVGQFATIVLGGAQAELRGQCSPLVCPQLGVSDPQPRNPPSSTAGETVFSPPQSPALGLKTVSGS